MLVVTVRLLLKPGFEEHFLERVARQALDSRTREPACRQFDVCAKSSEPQQCFLYEVYDDEAAFEGHLLSSHFLAFDAETRGWVDEKRVERWSLSLGHFQKGDPGS